jgi:tripeptidyl-peptidase-1
LDFLKQCARVINGGDITSGGGVSNFDVMPAFQAAAVNGYFSNLIPEDQPLSGYNRGGRAYPDVALLAHAYVVIVGGKEVLLSGTSASAPVFAAMVSLVNAARSKIGKSSLGYITPTLYALASSFVNDITSGNNKCVSASSDMAYSIPVCCDQGFAASAGWDPVSGLGSINFAKFLDAFVSL